MHEQSSRRERSPRRPRGVYGSDALALALPTEAVDALDTLPFPAAPAAPVPPAAPPPAPLPLRRRPRWRITARPPSWRVAATLVILLVIVLANVLVGLNRRYFDTISAGTYGLYRLHICESLGRTPEVLFTGSSRTEHNIDTPLMDQLLRQQLGGSPLSCNLGLDGSTFAHDYFLLKRYIEDGFVPKLIVETVWEFNFSRTADTYPLSYADLPWLGDVSDAPQAYQTFDPAQYADYLAQKAIPLYGDRIGLLKTACGHLTIGPCGANLPGIQPLSAQVDGYYLRQGFDPYTSGTLLEKWPQITADNPPCAPHCPPFTLTSSQPDYLAKFVALAHAHGIQVVLVVPPLSDKHYLYFNPGDWQRIDAFFTSFAALYGITFYDEGRAPGYTDADFWNTHHLLKVGADKFTTWLETAIVAPYFGGT